MAGWARPPCRCGGFRWDFPRQGGKGTDVPQAPQRAQPAGPRSRMARDALAKGLP
ncbi:hypothetical protein [Carbonactinospora thermoautotrophica]|uniref:hypothetical protein n=1 Tax=Carbonactinospora thermoautotrophica TaxID=1469144 RepID=UPI000ABB786B|nr:hypothetical protein [Carbonactinospora thermoautotrophica]